MFLREAFKDISVNSFLMHCRPKSSNWKLEAVVDLPVIKLVVGRSSELSMSS